MGTAAALQDLVNMVAALRERHLPAGGDPGVADADLAGAQRENGEEVVVGAERVSHGGQSALK
ncbi:hypothetical protein [Streptomyces sp. NBC_00057]|uniref:hypothetical protein n=1 Tax=Streptomyces sp. NBC_00057 TaxID=2975634 RepID=UPI00324E281A